MELIKKSYFRPYFEDSHLWSYIIIGNGEIL